MLNFFSETVTASPTSVNLSWKFARLSASAEVATATLISLQDFTLRPEIINRELSFGIFFKNTLLSVLGIYLSPHEEFAPTREMMLWWAFQSARRLNI